MKGEHGSSIESKTISEANWLHDVPLRDSPGYIRNTVCLQVPHSQITMVPRQISMVHITQIKAGGSQGKAPQSKLGLAYLMLSGLSC